MWRNQRGGVIAAGVTALVALAGMLAGPGYTAAPTLPTDTYADTDAAARTTHSPQGELDHGVACDEHLRAQAARQLYP